MENMKIYEAVRKVPQNAQKPIRGGRTNGFTDINPMWRIQTLTEQFGPCGLGWYVEVTDKRLEANDNMPTGEVSAFVDINLYVKYDGEWSKPIYGTGGSAFVAKEKNGLYQSDEAFKMAYTDAISVACKALGIGADIYWNEGRTKYSERNDESPAKAENRTQTAVTSAPDVDIRSKVMNELARTGVGLKSVLANYGAVSLSAMTNDQVIDCLGKLQKMPNRPEKKEN